MSTAPPLSDVAAANLERIQQQVRDNMKKAFWDKLEQDAAQKPLTPETVQWLGQLYGELRQRLAALTPRRADLHQELASALDVEQLVQVLGAGTVQTPMLEGMTRYIFGKLLTLCAPAQDRGLRCDQEVVLGVLDTQFDVNLGAFSALLLKRAHAALDQIEALIRQHREQLATMPGVRPC